MRSRYKSYAFVNLFLEQAAFIAIFIANESNRTNIRSAELLQTNSEETVIIVTHVISVL